MSRASSCIQNFSTEPSPPRKPKYQTNTDPSLTNFQYIEPPSPQKKISTFNINDLKSPSARNESPPEKPSLIKFSEDEDESDRAHREDPLELMNIEIRYSIEQHDPQNMLNLFNKKKSVNFTNIMANGPKKRNLQKCSQESEIMQFVMLRNKNFLKKILFFIRKFVISHICAALLSAFFILIQEYYGKYCYMPPNCLCHDDLRIKTYVFFKEYVSYWMIYIIFFMQSIFTNQLFSQSSFFKKGLFLLIATLFSCFWIVFSSESNYSPLFHYIFLILLCFIFEIYELLKKSQNSKEKFMIFIKINQFAFVIMLNYMFYLFIYEKVNSVLLYKFGEEYAKNVINFYISIYTLTITYCLKRIVLNYSKFLIKLSRRNTQAILHAMRSALCLFISFPASNILKMKISDWGGWFLICSYGNFLMGVYFKVDFFGILIEQIKKIFKKKEKKNAEQKDFVDEKNRIYIEKLLSGCVLDIQLICCLRMLILYFGKRWSGSFFRGEFYKNCKFEIDNDEFQINAWGIIVLVLINMSLAIFVFFYMIKKQNQLILYKIKHNFLVNVYMIFLNHEFLEAMINMFYLYIPK